MNIRTITTLLAIAAAAASTPALAGVGGPAAVHCEDSFTVFSAGYVACSGPLAGGLAQSVTFAGQGSFGLAGFTGDASGAFAADPGAVAFGTLALGAAHGGAYVIGLGGAASHSYYLFDGSSASVDFDTFGVADASGGAGPDLARAALYTVSAVPEPAPAALLLAGLAAVGFVARRRAG